MICHKVTIDRLCQESKIMTNVRKSITKALKGSGKTRYWLAKKTGIRVGTVYKYMTGDADLKSEAVGKMMDALGLEIRAKDGK
jgi:predicted transcriptional regulator